MKENKVKIHPFGEMLSKKLFGIENVPRDEVVKMRWRAIKEAVKWYDDKDPAPVVNPTEGEVKEDLLAEYAHKAWSGWMNYLFNKSRHNEDGTVTIPKWACDRWARQMNTNYEGLPKEEKKSDLEEAAKILEIMDNKHPQE